MIEALALSKRHGSRLAVDDLSFTVPDGAVTGLLGPSGSGKSTVLRLAAGLDRGSGLVLFDGVPFAALARPPQSVGVVLDPRALHPGRTALAHLRVLAAGAGVPRRRIAEVLEAVGLVGAERLRPGRFPRGAAQRLAVAGALLGRPRALLLDDPFADLDEPGRDWLQHLLREHAAAGGSALLAARRAADAVPAADALVVLRRGRACASGAVADLLAGAGAPVLVRASDPGALAGAVLRWGGSVDPLPDGALLVGGLDAAAVGEVARAEGVAVHELSRREVDLDAALARVELPETALLPQPRPAGAPGVPA
ncbi:ATP-binding cassette domain-containing protein [Quadrisphaera sp. KR29]|uniref:ATP-binding cassette domain-containing protein n=1 Tax=Quadrisphaera sp. KR29 TaxID=3461391 RepID=UPI004043E9F3